MNRFLRAIMLLVVLASLLVAGVSYALLAELRRPVDPQATEPVEFEVLPGQSASEVAGNLRVSGLVRQPLLFRLMLRQQDAADELNAGTYQLSPTMTMAEIIATLREEQQPLDETEFQIIEGMRMEEVAQVIVDEGLAPDTEAFLAVARNPAPFKANHERLQSIPDGQTLEGYLFPDTYRIESTATITDVIEKMLTDGFDVAYASFETEVLVPNQTVHKIVTMASIVQREAANEAEMPHLAYVFWNRLKPENLAETGGLLGADPTVQYVAGYSEEQQTWWRKDLTVEELEVDNPYNTRANPGLPPGPIASPGEAALRAAARPGELRPDGTDGTNDLYFVALCLGDAHTFAEDLDAFNALQQQGCNQ